MPGELLKFRFVAALAAALTLWATLASALTEPRWMSDGDILERFRDATIEGRYADGRSFTERYAANFRVTYAEASHTLGGHWSVTQGTLCTIYDYEPTGGCYRVSQVDENCYEFYFVSRTEDSAPGTDGTVPSWTARGAIQGRPSACRDTPSV